MRACLDEISKSLLPFDEVGPRQLKYPDDSPEVSESDDSSSLRQVHKSRLTSHNFIIKMFTITGI